MPLIPSTPSFVVMLFKYVPSMSPLMTILTNLLITCLLMVRPQEGIIHDPLAMPVLA